MRIRDYYSLDAVRQRMLQFMGGTNPDHVSAFYISRCDGPMLYDFVPKKPSELNYYLQNELDVARSLWDKRWLLVHLDIEYVNFDFPAEPYLDPVRTFEIQQPVLQAALDILAEYSIKPLHFVSGRGHHLIWKIDPASGAFQKLLTGAKLPPHMEQVYACPRKPTGKSVGTETGRAFAALGLVIEYLAHRIMLTARGSCSIPVKLTALSVGPQQRGREIISIDITEYGDPLHTRIIRIPFSAYLKPWEHWGVLHQEIRQRIPLMFLVPSNGMTVPQSVQVMRDIEKSAELASHACVDIPEQSQQTLALIADYESSELAGFHNYFYSQQHDDPADWLATYDRFTGQSIPRCIRHILDHPNDLLLKPVGIRQVAVVLMALGWHPRHIAGLIRSKYERDFGWLHEWYTYDAATRADFYVRVFAGLIETGADDLSDITCVQTRDKHFFYPEYFCDLEKYRSKLLERSYV